MTQFGYFLLVLLISCQTAIPSKDYVDIGNQYARDGLLREAQESYKKALAENPHNYSAMRNLGMILVKMGSYKNATKYLTESLPQYQDNFDSHYYIAEAYRAREMYADALFHYQKALQIRSDDPQTLKALAWSYYKIRFYSEALKTTRNLLKVAPKDQHGSIIMARTFLKLKRPRQALSVLKKLASEKDETLEAYFNSILGDVYFELKRFDKAFENYKLALKKQPLLAGALLGLGKYHMRFKRNDEAMKYIERASRIRPGLTEAYLLLGRLYEKTDTVKSIQYYTTFRKAASQDPDFLSQIPYVRKKISRLKFNVSQPNNLNSEPRTE